MTAGSHPRLRGAVFARTAVVELAVPGISSLLLAPVDGALKVAIGGWLLAGRRGARPQRPLRPAGG